MGKDYQKKPSKKAVETKGANPRKPSGIPKYQHFPKASLAPYPDEEGNAFWLGDNESLQELLSPSNILASRSPKNSESNLSLWGPARIIAIINNGIDIKHLILDSFLEFLLRFGCGTGNAFCTGTFLQTNNVTHRSLFTEQFLRADILTQRGLCTKKNVHRRNCIWFRAVWIWFGVWILVCSHGFRYCKIYFIYIYIYIQVFRRTKC